MGLYTGWSKFEGPPKSQILEGEAFLNFSTKNLRIFFEFKEGNIRLKKSGFLVENFKNGFPSSICDLGGSSILGPKRGLQIWTTLYIYYIIIIEARAKQKIKACIKKNNIRFFLGEW